MRVQPVHLLIDASGAMYGECMEAVNHGLQALVGQLRQNPVALEGITLSLHTFATHVRQHVSRCELLEFEPPRLAAGGLRCFGAGLTHLAERMRQELRPRQLGTRENYDGAPFVFILIGGEPTDDWLAGQSCFQQVSTSGTILVSACSHDSWSTLTPNRLLIERQPSAIVDSISWLGQSLGRYLYSMLDAEIDDTALDLMCQLPPTVQRIKPQQC